MSAFANINASSFAFDVENGLSGSQKYIPAQYLYDPIGISLFESITLLPEYGIASAEERILRRHLPEMLELLQPVSIVAKLGNGCGRAAARIVRGLTSKNPDLRYRPSRFSSKASSPLENTLNVSDWLDQAARFASDRSPNQSLLLMLFGSAIGNLDRSALNWFLKELRTLLRSGDYFLVGADLIKENDKLMTAYDDPAGITAAFNKNLLVRVNRELGGHFNLRQFDHAVHWNAFLRRTEMHLLSRQEQDVYVGELGRRFHFQVGETIQTGLAYKFSETELEQYADVAGFSELRTWIDLEWRFADLLWTV